MMVGVISVFEKISTVVETLILVVVEMWMVVRVLLVEEILIEAMVEEIWIVVAVEEIWIVVEILMVAGILMVVETLNDVKIVQMKLFLIFVVTVLKN